MFKDTSTTNEKNVAVLTRGEFLEKLEMCANLDYIGSGFEVACEFVGGARYLLLRDDNLDDFVVSSNWPYDLAKKFGKLLLTDKSVYGDATNANSAFEPSFIELDSSIIIPDGFSRKISILPIACGEQKHVLVFLFKMDSMYGQERLKDAALACAYHLAEYIQPAGLDSSHSELTEREMECLTWIAKGKTSDEIAMIIGISRNTVNNYITSIMNKTSTKSRAEAVAEAVRGQLI